jgi:hypothetical protein
VGDVGAAPEKETYNGDGVADVEKNDAGGYHAEMATSQYGAARKQEVEYLRVKRRSRRKI